ncbi:MAG: hypothetical protein ABI439_14050 [Rhodospirillales bacterium]
MNEPLARARPDVRLTYWARIAIAAGLGICAVALTALAAIPS